MKVKLRILALVLVCALLLPATVLAVGPPGFPPVFTGTVKINGVDAPPGTVITAEVESVQFETMTTGIPGSYTFSFSVLDATKVGKTITFKVNSQVGGTATYPASPDPANPVVVNLAIGDTTAPTVTGNPTGNSEPVDTVVTATFNEPMNTASAQGAFSISPSVGVGVFSWAGNVMTFTPPGDLDYGTKYTVTIAVSAQDVVGNPLASAKSWSFTTVKGPYLTTAKTVSPYVIGKKGSGLTPEVSTVTLTVTGAGPLGGTLTGVVVTDVLPDYINYEGSPSIFPSTTTVIAGVTTLTWNVAPIAVGTTWTVSFDISSDDCGRVLANEYSTSNVAYLDAVSAPVTEVFPKTYLVVLCPEEGVSCVVEPGTPAEMSIQNISVNGEEFVQTQEIEVTVSVGNSGGTEGSKTVALYVNGVYEDSQSVSVGPGSGQNVLFRVVGRAVPGTYTVSVEGREAQFTVLGMGPPQAAPAPPMAVAGVGGGLGTGGIVAIIVVIVALGIGLVFILRREST